MPRDRLRYLLALAGVFAAYVVGGKLGLQLASVNASATAVWPPTGIAIAALLLLGYRAWPAIFAGAFVVNLTTSGDVSSSIGIAVGNTLEGLVAAYLADRFANGRFAFLHAGTVLRFAALAAIAAPTISATVGVETLTLAGLAPVSDFGRIWITWWLGDVTGAMLVAPLIILWATDLPRLRGQGSTEELAALAVTVAAVALVTFTPASPLAAANLPIQFLVFPVLVWPVVRFGPRVAATIAAALSFVAVWGTIQHAGPWVHGSENESLLFVQGFMGIATLTSLVVAAAILERQHAEDTLRATEERLRKAEERKVAARDEFLSVAAHELRTPLTSLHLAVQMLEREASREGDIRADAVRAELGHVRSQTARLGKLVNQLLDGVRVQTSRMDLEIADDDVVAIAQRVASEAQALTTRHDIEVHAQGPVIAAVDALRIEQVLRNLVENAVKFSRGGKVAIDASTEEGTVILAVRDHGPGIAAEHRDHVFDAYYRGVRSPGGLGLGLHVSRHIVALHGGSIAADFPNDGGTRIILRLPMNVPVASKTLEPVG